MAKRTKVEAPVNEVLAPAGSALSRVPPPGVEPEDAVKRLNRMSQLVRKLGKYGREEVLEAVGEVHEQVEDELRTVIHTAPKELVKIVRDSMLETIKVLEGDKKEEKLDWLGRGILNVTHDPRNAAEAAEALSAVAGKLSKSPKAVRKLASRTLHVLELKGVLGEGTLANIVAFLVAGAAAVGIVRFVAGGGYISIPLPGKVPVSLSLNRLGGYSASIRIHNPNWPKWAASLAVQRQVSSESQMGRPPVTGFRVEPVKVTFPVGRTSVTVSPYAKGKKLHKGRDERLLGVGVGAKIRFGAEEEPEAESAKESFDYVVAGALAVALSLGLLGGTSGS